MMTPVTRDALDALLQEAYDGPPDPSATLFVSNVIDSGVLGTTKHLTAEQAWAKPHGVAHSVAEHVAHLAYGIDFEMKTARGESPADEWATSWDVGPVDEGKWHTLQRTLREAQLRMRMWIHADEPFATPGSVSRFIGTVAHAAYHLGAIRQLAAIVHRQHDSPDPQTTMCRPL